MDNPVIFDPAAFAVEYVEAKPGRTLIVGSYIVNKPDRRKFYSDAIGVDMRPGPGVDVVADMESAQAARLGKFAHIECCSVLEHSRRPWKLAANLEALLEPGGTIHVEVPFHWRVHAYPDDYWRMTASAIQEIFPSLSWRVILYRSHLGFHKNPKSLPKIGRDGTHWFAKSMICGFGVLEKNL